MRTYKYEATQIEKASRRRIRGDLGSLGFTLFFLSFLFFSFLFFSFLSVSVVFIFEQTVPARYFISFIFLGSECYR